MDHGEEPAAPPDVLRLRRQWFKAQERALEALHRFAVAEVGRGVGQQAWDEFMEAIRADPEADRVEEASVQQAFAWWFVTLYPLTDAEIPTFPRPDTIAARYLARVRFVEARVRDYIELARQTPLSFHQITEVRPGVGVGLRDLFRGSEAFLYDLSISRVARPHGIFLGQLIDVGGLHIMGLALPSLLPPESRELLDRLVALGAPAPGWNVSTLLEAHRQMLMAYGSLMEGLRNQPPPRLTNTDGDVLEFHVTRYALAPERRAEVLERLGAIPEVAADDEPDETAVGFTWRVDQPENAMMPNVVKGSLRVEGDVLVLETNSRKRDKTLRSRVESALGKLARRQGTERRSVQEMMASRPAEAAGEAAAPQRRRAPTAPEVPPEVQAQVSRMMRERVLAWADTPVPRLGGKTPRQACRTAKGRRLVSQMLDEWEFRVPPGKSDTMDVAALRRSLGLPPSGASRPR